MQRILARYCVFKTCEIWMFDTPFLGQFLSDFVRVKSNVSPRPLTCPREIFDRTTPLTFIYYWDILNSTHPHQKRFQRVKKGCPSGISTEGVDVFSINKPKHTVDFEWILYLLRESGENHSVNSTSTTTRI